MLGEDLWSIFYVTYIALLGIIGFSVAHDLSLSLISRIQKTRHTLKRLKVLPVEH